MKLFLSIILSFATLGFLAILIISTIDREGRQGRPGLNEVSGTAEVQFEVFNEIYENNIYGDEISYDNYDVVVLDFGHHGAHHAFKKQKLLLKVTRIGKIKGLNLLE